MHVRRGRGVIEVAFMHIDAQHGVRLGLETFHQSKQDLSARCMVINRYYTPIRIEINSTLNILSLFAFSGFQLPRLCTRMLGTMNANMRRSNRSGTECSKHYLVNLPKIARESCRHRLSPDVRVHWLLKTSMGRWGRRGERDQRDLFDRW